MAGGFEDVVGLGFLAGGEVDLRGLDMAIVAIEQRSADALTTTLGDERRACSGTRAPGGVREAAGGGPRSQAFPCSSMRTPTTTITTPKIRVSPSLLRFLSQPAPK